MSGNRRPGSTSVLKYPELVQQRHDDIMRLWQENEGMTYTEIASRVGLTSRFSVAYHLNGQCKCKKAHDAH